MIANDPWLELIHLAKVTGAENPRHPYHRALTAALAMTTAVPAPRQGIKSMHTTPLTRDLARALGVPDNARKAVLILERGELPRLNVEFLPTGMETRTGSCNAEAVGRLPFILRLWLQDTRTKGETR